MALNPAISICVLTKPMYSRDPRLHLDFRLRDPSGLLLTNDLQIHLLQLSKLSKTVQNVSQASSIEKWAYFLVNAANLSLNGIEELFPEAEFSEAAGVLDMISHNPEQRQLYDARLKLQLDEAARLEGALNQGREEGRAEGELFGQIMLLQELLGIAELTRDELTNLSEVQLSEVTEEFKRRLRNRSV